MVALVVRGLFRRPSLSGTPTVTFCSVHIHNVVAKKRDASTSSLQALHAHMLQHNVDLIGSDFNMSAYSTVGHVFADQEFAAPGSSLLWGLGALTDTDQERTGSSSCPNARTNGALTFTAATNLTMRNLASDLVITQRTSLSFCICALQTSPAQLSHAQPSGPIQTPGTCSR